MHNFRLFFLLILISNGKSLHSQLLGCNSSNVIVDTIFPSSSTTNFTAYATSILLCGPNTVVFDTIIDGWGNNPIRNLVFIGDNSKYIIKGIDNPDYVAIFVKSTATLDFRPALSLNSNIILLMELGATILNNSGFPFYDIDTCSNLIFPPGCGLTELSSDMEIKAEAIRIWPSPVENLLQLQCAMDSEEPNPEVLLYNNLGQLVQQEKIVFENEKATIPITRLANGIYFLELKTTSGTFARKRFVIAR